jgi:membrane protein involved in colicin uptake
MYKNITVVLLLVLAAGCVSKPRDGAYAPPMDLSRKVSEQDCTRSLDDDGGNLLCREVTEAERLARIAAAERQANARREAEARAERERLERERAEQLAREEAARKARAAEEERLAAERRRLEEEAARKAQEERERREKAEAEERARLKAEQEAREAAARECRRLEQERSEGRALLAVFVADYGKDEEFKGIAGQIAAFLDKPRKVKPCPPA